MARVIDSFPEAVRTSQYPWDEWGNGQIWELVEGEDFKTKTETFRTTVKKAAQSRGKAVRTAARQKAGRRILIIQFTRKPRS